MLKILEKLYQKLQTKDRGRQGEALGLLKEFVDLYEDGLEWKGKHGIREHLTKGCSCPQVKNKEEFEKGGY